MSYASSLNDNCILIANRGEIACRIIRTAKKMGMKTVAVHSNADSRSIHTTLADQSFYIGSSSPSDSYLNIDRILAVADKVNANMIHPGYGFLSENADFAERCLKKGVTFIGPSAKAIVEMGSKSQAKVIMTKAKVPLIPGYHGNDQSDQHLLKKAKDIGLPVLIKAASGGGGKGMRVVYDIKDFIDSMASARREAISSFGDPKLLLESYLTNTRHVEVQIFFDRKGHGIYLFDRDCSLQRRHQKIIEEAPAPGLSNKIRKDMGEAAIAVGRAINYEGAGTVEFLLSGSDFFFLEVNTRLQVEHPITERITGIDLVEWQILIAMGENLPLQQNEVKCTGHAIEARIYAEDTNNNFLPSSGRIIHLDWPDQDDIRIDSGVKQGDIVSTWYDPMLAKIVSWGNNRKQAIDNLTDALAQTYISGLTNNRDYLIALLQHYEFKKVNISTRFINDYFSANENTMSPIQDRKILTVAALYRYYSERSHLDSPLLSSSNSFPSYFYLKEQEHCIQVAHIANSFQLNFADGNCDSSVTWKTEKHGLSGVVSLMGNNTSCRVIPLPKQLLAVFLPDCSAVLGLPGFQAGTAVSSDMALTAPMNGTVTVVNVKSGQKVDMDSILMTMEAMKMELSIKAPREGIINSVYFRAGDQVESGNILIDYQDNIDATA